MTLKSLVNLASDKSNFASLSAYMDFCWRYLDFVDEGLQAIIVSQNEQKYRFFQYKKDGNFNVTRPLNWNLMFSAKNSHRIRQDFIKTLRKARDLPLGDQPSRTLICNAIYTIQQCIGCALDALPSGKSNTARKIAGDLFERLVRLLIQELGIDCTTGTIRVPVIVEKAEKFDMSYQHDLIIKKNDEVKAIGGVKTCSKDRLDKIFVDKFLYCKLTETCIPHIAIFLNDVQRKSTKALNQYGINATFLPGHFKGYTIKLNPLDGVYYCDIRPNMLSDPMLRKHIKTIDHFFCEDLWRFLGRRGAVDATVEPAPDE